MKFGRNSEEIRANSGEIRGQTRSSHVKMKFGRNSEEIRANSGEIRGQTGSSHVKMAEIVPAVPVFQGCRTCPRASYKVTGFLRMALSSELFSQIVGWTCMHTCTYTKEPCVTNGTRRKPKRTSPSIESILLTPRLCS